MPAGAPMGTLTNSTQRHDSQEVRIPPAIRPMAPPATATAPKTPKARLRSSPSAKLVVINDSAVGAAMAAPTPWRARAASSQPDGGGQAAEEGGQGEDQDAGDEGAAAAQDVAGPAAQQQQAAEGEGVGVQHPRQAGGGEAEGLLDLGQGDVHDGRVQHHHELGGRDDGEGQRGMVPAAWRAGRWWSRRLQDGHGRSRSLRLVYDCVLNAWDGTPPTLGTQAFTKIS